MDDIHTLLRCVNSENALEELAESTVHLHTTLAKTVNNADNSSNSNNSVGCGTDSCQGEQLHTDTFHFLRWLIFAHILPLPLCKPDKENSNALHNNSDMCSKTNVECRIKECWNDAIATCQAEWHAAQEVLHNSTKKNMNSASRTENQSKLETYNVKNNSTTKNEQRDKVSEKTGIKKNKFDDSDSSSEDVDILGCTNHQSQQEEQQQEKPTEVHYHTPNSVTSHNKSVNATQIHKWENPLLPETNSIYAHEYEVMHVRGEIEKDVERLHWDQCPLFASHNTQEEELEQELHKKCLPEGKKCNTKLHLHENNSHKELIELLLTYCVYHHRPYRQGMHELMVFIMFAAWSDQKLMDKISMQSTERSTQFDNWLVSFIKGITDYRLALIYTLFTHLIDSHYCVSNAIASEEEEKEQEGQHEVSSVWMGLEEWYYAEDDNGRSGVVHSCELVQNVLLKHIDAFFSFQLTHEHEVHSVVYLVRWLRLLFLREFTLAQALSIWDVIFAQASRHTCESLAICDNNNNEEYNNSSDLHDNIVIKPTMSFTLWFATAMLLTLRQAMMHLEECQVLQLLMKYPRVRHVKYVIALAIQLERWWSANQHVARMTPFAIEKWWPLFTDHEEDNTDISYNNNNTSSSFFVKSMVSTEPPRVSNIPECLETSHSPEHNNKNKNGYGGEEDWQEFEEMSLIPFHYHHHHQHQRHDNNSSNLWENEFTLQPISDVLRRQGQRATQLLKNVQQLFKTENEEWKLKKNNILVKIEGVSRLSSTR